jgi:hypothetical protein
MTGDRHTGRCACGAVRYVVDGPLTPVAACHCESCRRQTGSFYMATGAPAASVRIEGADNLSQWQATRDAVRRFCRICGSHLFWQRVGSDQIDILAGSLDTPTGLSLTHHIYVSEKGDFYGIADGLPQYALRPEAE